jgi:hypothetical protein
MDSVKIGDQIWSLENSTFKFSDREDIHHCTTKEDRS